MLAKKRENQAGVHDFLVMMVRKTCKLQMHPQPSLHLHSYLASQIHGHEYLRPEIAIVTMTLLLLPCEPCLSSMRKFAGFIESHSAEREEVVAE